MSRSSHLGLERRRAHHRGDRVRDADHLRDAPALLRGGEVGADPLADVGRRADVEHLVARAAEQVDARRLRQPVGQVALAAHLRRDGVGRGGKVLEVRDAERCQALEQAVQDVDRGPGVAERTMLGCDPSAEESRERGQPVVAGLVARDDPARQGHGVHHGEPGPRVAEPLARGLEEADVVGRVVGDEHAVARELQEARQDQLDRGSGRDHGRGDAREARDERRHRMARVDQRLQLAEHLAAAHLDRADLGDAGVLRAAAGRLEVDDDERDVPQRGAELLERGLELGARRPRRAGRGRHGPDASGAHRHGRDDGRGPVGGPQDAGLVVRRSRTSPACRGTAVRSRWRSP